MKGVRLVDGPNEGKYIHSERQPQTFSILGGCGTAIYRLHGKEEGFMSDVAIAVPATASLAEEAELIGAYVLAQSTSL